MALFTDGNISSMFDLSAQDTGLMGVSGTEGIDLTGKLALAQEELGVELAPLLPAPAALGQVVVTAPLRLWHVFHTLELVYRDAFNNQLNDRYKGKWEQYRDLSQWAMGKLLETGVGIVADPVPRAKAAELSVAASGAGAEETTVYASVAWVNAKGEQGEAGPWSLKVVPAGCVVVVKAVRPPDAAKGWNVYVGRGVDEQSRQNFVPLEPRAPWTQTAPLSEDGPRPGSGQEPDYVRALPRVLQRG